MICHYECAMNNRLLSAALVSALITACSLPRSQESETSPAGHNVLSDTEMAAAKAKPDFARHVKPILEGKCAMCHNRKTLPGRMSLENREAAFKPAPTGIPIVPGKPEQSILIANIQSAHAHINAMPPVGERITQDELAVLRKWIADGAEWPKGRAGRLNPDAGL